MSLSLVSFVSLSLLSPTVSCLSVSLSLCVCLLSRCVLQADHLNGREGSQGAEAAAAAASGTEKGGARRTRGFPRVIKAGHGTKLGAVVSP